MTINGNSNSRTRRTRTNIVAISTFIRLLISPILTLCQEAPPRKLNWRPVLLMTAAAVGAAIVDVEATQHCLAAGTCREANPLIPSSRPGMYAVKSAFAIGTTFEGSAFARSHAPFPRRIWWMPQAVYFASSTYGASTGLRVYGKSSPQVRSLQAR